MISDIKIIKAVVGDLSKEQIKNFIASQKKLRKQLVEQHGTGELNRRPKSSARVVTPKRRKD